MTLTHQPGAPRWVDLGTTDIAGAVAFYGALFGWAHQDLGPEAGGYGFFTKDGRMAAGIGPATDAARGTSWAVYFGTENSAATAGRVEASGGKVIVPPDAVMDQGTLAVFTDPAGAFFSTWQPGSHDGVGIMREPGALSWVELYTPDPAGAKEFYGAVFAMSHEDRDMGGEVYSVISVAGQPVGGIFEPPGAAGMPAHWMPYFGVADTDASADRAIELGAVQMMRGDYSDGRLAILTDPQGGLFGILTW